MLKNKNTLIIIIYVAFFALFFLPFIKGIGNYWDWLFPYFREHWHNALFDQSYAWITDDLGSSLSYNSWYFYRTGLFALLGLSRLNPETFQYLFLVCLFSVGAYLAFLLVNRRLENRAIASLISLTMFLNPAIFYKLSAGHLTYLFSFVGFIGLTYFLFYLFKNRLYDYVLLGLGVALIGVQIQFFIFAFILLAVFFAFNRDKFSTKYLFVTLTIIVMISLPWLSNFLVGSRGLSDTSSWAESISFSGSSYASVKRIIVSAFSPATTISSAYSRTDLLFFGCFNLLIALAFFFYFFISKKRDKIVITTMVLAIIFGILGTGFFHSINIYPVTVFLPILREIGHFSPVIIFYLLLLLSMVLPCLTKNRVVNRITYFLLVVYILVNVQTFQRLLPKVNFASARSQLQSYNQLLNEASGTYRFLSYPFFNQYGFATITNFEQNGRLFNNSGWDSFAAFSGKDFLTNYAAGINFTKTPQYHLLQNYDISELEKYNVLYIIDLQRIYTSNFERYTDSKTYGNNLALIKNDPAFLDKIVAENRDRVTKISDTILKLNKSRPRLDSPNITFQRINPTEYEVSFSHVSGMQTLTFWETFDRNWLIYPLKQTDTSSLIDCQSEDNEKNITECREASSESYLERIGLLTQKPIFKDSHVKVGDYANGWTIDANQVENQLSRDYYKINDDGSIDFRVKVYYKPESFRLISLTLSIIAIFISAGFLLWWRKREER